MRESSIHHFVTPSRSAKSAYQGVSELIRIEAPETEVAALFTAMRVIKGAHRVEVRWASGDVINGEYVESPWRTITFRGTAHAVRRAATLLAFSCLQNVDPNADHDHPACLAAARRAGVPAEWAHMIETYLSM